MSTTRDRLIAALELKTPDRVPVLPMIGDHAGVVNGLPLDVMYSDAEKAADAHLKALRRYKYDTTAIQVEPSWPLIEACGGAVAYPPDKNPWITRHPIRAKDDLSGLSSKDLSSFGKVFIRGTRILVEKADVPVMAYLPGPLSFFYQLVSYSEGVKWIRRDKESVHRALRICVDVIREYGQALKEVGTEVAMISEHDIQLSTPTDLKEFSVPYLQEILAIHDYNILHMCGRVWQHLKTHLPELAGLKNLQMISISSEVDLAEAKQLLKGKMGIAGNIDHINLLPHGSPTEVDAACGIAINQGKPEGGYILAPGCEITVDTPPANVDAFVRSASKYGRY